MNVASAIDLVLGGTALASNVVFAVAKSVTLGSTSKVRSLALKPFTHTNPRLPF